MKYGQVFSCPQQHFAIFKKCYYRNETDKKTGNFVEIAVILAKALFKLRIGNMCIHVD